MVDVNAELFNRRRSVYLLRDDSQGTRIVPSSFPTRLFQPCDIVTLERSLRISYRYLYLSNVQEWSSRCKHNHPLSLIRIINIYYCIDTIQVHSNWKKINILKKIQLKKSDRGKFWYALYTIFKSKQIRVSVKFVNIRNWLDSSITLKPLNFLFMKSMRTTDWTLINLIWSIIHYPTIVLQFNSNPDKKQH